MTTRRKAAKAPAGLSAESAKLWKRVNADYDMVADAAGEALLLELCLTLDRLRQCQKAIASEGLTVDGSTGQTRSHPLLAVESENRRTLLAIFRALRLEPPEVF